MKYGILTLIICSFSFIKSIPQCADNVVVFFKNHAQIGETLKEKIGNTCSQEAMAIVAPEVCAYSSLYDKAETYTLKVLYAQTGRGNFSIGYFQMKPSFAEQIEAFISTNKSLKNKYAELLIDEENEQASRAERVTRLSSLKYQTLYLAAFYEIASSIIDNWISSKKDKTQRLKNLATLYNGGVKLSEAAALELQSRKQFPAIGLKKANYSDLVILFYKYLYER